MGWTYDCILDRSETSIVLSKAARPALWRVMRSCCFQYNWDSDSNSSSIMCSFLARTFFCIWLLPWSPSSLEDKHYNSSMSIPTGKGLFLLSMLDITLMWCDVCRVWSQPHFTTVTTRHTPDTSSLFWHHHISTQDKWSHASSVIGVPLASTQAMSGQWSLMNPTEAFVSDRQCCMLNSLSLGLFSHSFLIPTSVIGLYDRFTLSNLPLQLSTSDVTSTSDTCTCHLLVQDSTR